MAQFGLSFGISLGLQLIGAALTPPQTVGKLENKKVPDSSYGSRYAYGSGTFLTRGILIAAPDEFTESSTKRGKIGGKTVEFSYSATLAFGLCRNQIQTIPQIKLNGNKVVDFLSREDQILQDSTEFYNDIQVRLGTPNQPPVAALNSFASPNPGYRNIALVVLPNFGLTEDYGNRPPLFEALVSTSATINNANAAILDQHPLFIQTVTSEPEDPEHPVYASNQGPDSIDITTAGIASAGGTYTTDPITPTYRDYIEAVLPDTDDPSIRLLVDGLPAFHIDISGGALNFRLEGGNNTSVPFNSAGSAVRIYWNSANQIQVMLNGALIGGTFTIPAGTRTYQLDAKAETYLIQASKIVSGVTTVELENVPLSQILQDICSAAGVTADVSEIDDQILGIAFKGDSPKENIEQLQEIFGFFTVDSGNQIKFLNGIRPPAVRTFTDLDEFGTINSRPYDWEQKQLSELPYEIEVRHYDIFEEQETSQYWRNDSQSPTDQPKTANKIQIDTGATLTPAAAIGIAEMTAARIWQEREKYKLTTTIANGDLEPGDTIILPYLGEPQEFLLTQVSYGANWLLEFEAVRYHRGPWQRKKTPVLPTSPESISNPHHAQFFIAQVPRISSAHPNNSVYWAASSSSPSWQSCQLLASGDMGQTFVQVSDTAIAGSIGVLLEPLPEALVTLNPSQSVIVRVTGELSTITQELFNRNNQANWIIIGDEIVKFRDATLIADQGQYRYYEIGHLKRGQNSTSMGEKPYYTAVGLVADLSVIDRAAIGDPGDDVQFQLFLDGISSKKEAHTYTII